MIDFRTALAAGALFAGALVAAEGAIAQSSTAETQKNLKSRKAPQAQAPAQAPAAAQQPQMPAAAPATPAPAAKPAVRGPEQEYKECLNLWDAATHMTRAEWAATCRRIQNRLNDITAEAKQISGPNRRRAR